MSTGDQSEYRERLQRLSAIFTDIAGSALNLNVHAHILALDGVYTFDGERPRFHRVAPPAAEDLERLLDTLIRRITRTLVRSGALIAQEYDDEEQLWLDLDSEGEDALAQLQGASIRYRTTGSRGARPDPASRGGPPDGSSGARLT